MIIDDNLMIMIILKHEPIRSKNKKVIIIKWTFPNLTRIQVGKRPNDYLKPVRTRRQL